MPKHTQEILLQETSPSGNIAAIVESNGENIHFYLFGSPETDFGIRSCWVRNLKPAPAAMNRGSMEEGSAPLLPADSCAHPNGAPPLAPANLKIVWFEQGDGAALLEGDQILAIIPGWSGQGGFHGFARDCTAESPLCWPLGTPDTNVLFERVERARGYWRSWNDNPWPVYSDAQIAAYHASFGSHTKYFAIDGGKWPPKALLRFERPDQILFATVGVSLRPMPGVEMTFDDPGPLQRIELAMGIDPRLADASALQRIGQYISGQSSYPWRRYTFFGEGHTLPCDSIPVGPSGIAFTSALFVRSPRGAPSVSLPGCRGDPVNLLWMVPITQRELAVAKEQGSRKIFDALAAAGQSFVHRDRREVVRL